MAFIVKGKNGKDFKLLNPQEKKQKAATELKLGVKLTNYGRAKVDNYGIVHQLSDTEKAYRSGLISGISTCQRAYNKKTKKMLFYK